MPRSPTFRLGLPGTLKAQITEAAADASMTPTAWIQRALQRELDRIPPKGRCPLPPEES